MKVKDKLEELEKTEGLEAFFILSQVGSFINFMEDAIYEIDDDDLTEKYGELQNMIQDKRIAIGEKELQEWPTKKSY